ncbi:hypothetical protein Agabi119p4_755 [Agaricus bisporus var. burnettii]|uniref:Uncharacterized protein n=1 Tax=Agaricus bisporus var. burnettii TaxID=192524 RepID=A0A8H7FB41_AGABI|nr:hypothetical protein Agabi119p4_755 [Agaricus bisporus var. burnettii]
MSAQNIKCLLSAPTWQSSNTKTIKWLNESFAGLDSLQELESLLHETEIRHKDLQDQLSSSNDEIRSLILNTRSSAEEHISTSKELSLLRHSLTDELSELSDELVSVLHGGDRDSTLLEDIETLHRSLKELESVRGYVQVIHHGLQLSESAISQIQSLTAVSTSSVSVFQDLQNFVEKVATASTNVEGGHNGQKLHIVKFLEKIRDKTWADIKGVVSSELIATAEKIGWPMNINYGNTSPRDRESFEGAFVNLLNLQTIAKAIGAENHSDTTGKSGIYPIQALVVPVSLRFKYHFEGTRETNRLDKPEWYFTHILNIAHEHRQFMDEVVQPLLQASEYKSIHAWREFALHLLPLLSRKIRKTIPALLQSPSVLAHTIYQALTFDISFTEEGFQLQGTSAAASDGGDTKWDGVSTVILGNEQWFQAWLLGEQKFVEGQYQDLIHSSDAWEISDDTESSPQATALKSTNSARRIKALFEQVTDRYSPLPSPLQRIHFLISIQLPILDSYLSRITSSLDAFETLSLAFVRSVPGALNLTNKGDGIVNVNTQNLTSGIEGIQRLCKALLSAAHIELALEGWTEDVFFLELWSDIHHIPSLRERVSVNPLLPNPGPEDTDVPNETIFEVFINKYTTLIIRAENMIVQQICNEIESRLKAHFNLNISESVTESSLTEAPLVSQTLLAPLTRLSTYLSYLLSTLSQTSFTTLYRRIATHLAEHILHRQILYRGSFSVLEGRRIFAECELWIETCHSAIMNGGQGLPGGRGRVEAPWGKLLQAGRLIGLEGEDWDKVVHSTLGALREEQWEDNMRGTTGYSELSRDIVGRILRSREDFDD